MSSWTLANLLDATVMVGVAALVSGLVGVTDNTSQALRFVAVGALLALGAVTAGRRVDRPAHTSSRHVIVGIGVIWAWICLVGAVVYVLSGALGNIEDAVVESVAGFTTTALTLIDTSEASRSLLLWRAATSWVGGLVAIVAAVIGLPAALRSNALLAYSSASQGYDLVPNASVGTRRVLWLYAGFTVACVCAYGLVGLGALDATVVGMGTASTGGFSPRADSLSSFGAGPAAVAGVGMLLAGGGIFVLWWIARGRVRPLLRSQELHTYLFVLAAMVAVIVVTSDVSPASAAFGAVSMLSTTGFAITDWTAWPLVDVDILVIAAAVGAMLGSAGGGVRVVRARMLIGYATRELRLQINPHAVVHVRRDGRPVDERTLERVGSYVITHVGVICVGAVALGIAGLSVSDSLWASVSAVSTLGPAAGEIGAFGQLDGVGRASRLTLVPLMLAGRVAILPLLAMLGLLLSGRRMALRRLRHLGWLLTRRLDLAHRLRSMRSRRTHNEPQERVGANGDTPNNAGPTEAQVGADRSGSAGGGAGDRADGGDTNRPKAQQVGGGHG